MVLTMIKHYLDYKWENGLPVGKTAILPQDHERSYKIVSDPYHKWVSVEQYHNTGFSGISYDSRLLDFRKLKPVDQNAWRQELEKDTDEESVSLIRNQDDQVVYRERCLFRNDRCMRTVVESPHGLLLATQRMFYEDLGDPFTGVELRDREQKCVLVKKYAWDKKNRQFTTLLSENWRP